MLRGVCFGRLRGRSKDAFNWLLFNRSLPLGLASAMDSSISSGGPVANIVVAHSLHGLTAHPSSLRRPLCRCVQPCMLLRCARCRDIVTTCSAYKLNVWQVVYQLPLASQRLSLCALSDALCSLESSLVCFMRLFSQGMQITFHWGDYDIWQELLVVP